uniref:Uncharacterized protein n=1 Tax=Rhizophagus irregularis (strain DAOM 181602 / DAOM 197198 / MUCL 43194) TaxID=747089 RepID=U9SVZ7_RHIID
MWTTNGMDRLHANDGSHQINHLLMIFFSMNIVLPLCECWLHVAELTYLGDILGELEDAFG